jgi:hypothetical protein
VSCINGYGRREGEEEGRRGRGKRKRKGKRKEGTDTSQQIVKLAKKTKPGIG